MFRSKYEKNYDKELRREISIQKLMNEKGYDRVHAVHWYDYNQEINRQKMWKGLSALIFGFTFANIPKIKFFSPYAHKKVVQLPLFAVGAYAGVRLWEKLIGHYFNYIDYDVSQDFKIKYEERYKLFQESPKEQTEFTLKQLKGSSINFINQGKNSNDASQLSQIRNLENIIYVKEDEIKKCQTLLDLQVLIDSAIPTVDKLSTNEKLNQFQNRLYRYKLAIENLKIFESEKERMLGLPFQLIRQRQFPEPEFGTWQFNLFEDIFGHPYSEGRDEVETEEKIHKFNYHKFLHPSIIEKYNDNPNDEEFEMLIKMKNVESKTRLEKLKDQRKLFCTKILPKLNLLNDEQKGREFAYTYLNHINNKSSIQNHFYKNYSNQEEEALFREAEELRLVDKNNSVVEKFETTTIKPEYKGIRAKELNEILSNPNKKNEIQRALKAKYKHYSPLSKYELLKQNLNKIAFVDTVIEEGIDLNNPEQFNYKNLHEKTHNNPDLNEHEEAALSSKNGTDDNISSFPLGHPQARFFKYDNRISFEDYQPEIPQYGFISYKNNRYEYRIEEEKRNFEKEFNRKYPAAAFKEQEGLVVPHLERANEEIQDKIFKRNASKMTEERRNLYKNEINQMEEFVNQRVSNDTSKNSDNLTENDLNQAIFEAQYQKPIEETDEFKLLGKRSKDEILALFKLNKMTPYEFWDHDIIPKRQEVKRVYTEASQINDPIFHLFSEVEQPEALRTVLKKWRKGAEIRTKLPYYPETKKPEQYFSLI